MSGFWGNVLASSVALLILFAIMGVVYLLYTRSGMKKKASYFEKIHTELARGHVRRRDLRHGQERRW